jgi:transcriptional regulator with XRE-family HTH domain
MTTSATPQAEEFSVQTAANIQKMMTEKGITTEQLVEQLKLTPKQADSLSTGHDLGINTLYQVAGALGVQGPDLFPSAFPWSNSK